MLPDKAWKVEAIMRLLLSVVVCFFAGSFLLTALQHESRTAMGHAPVYALVAAALACLGAVLGLLQKSWRADDGLYHIAILLGLFYAALMLGGWAARIAGPIKPSVTQMIVSALSLQGALLMLVPPFLRDHQTTWLEGFGLARGAPRALLFGVILACAFLPIGWTLQGISAEVMSRFHLRPEQQQVVQTLTTDRTLAGSVVFGLITVLLVPVAEESFFRGILYAWIKQVGYPRLALWGTSVVFAAVHANLVSFVPLTVLALVLALLYGRTGNLLAPISAHALFNAVNLARLYLLEHALSP